MGKFDRYMLRQLLMVFGFIALVMTLIFWVNRAVGLLDLVMGDGHGLATFLELSFLSLPSVIVNLLPIAGFGAAVMATNRLSSESELVVVQAAGYSPYRMARPVLVYGLVVTLMVGAIAHVFEPLANREQDIRRSEIRRDVTARLLTEGTFVHPVSGVTFYVREITPAGELRDVYLSNSRDPARRDSFTASRALIIKDDDAPKLLMFDGTAQTLLAEGQRLAVTRFDSFTYGLGEWISSDGTPAARLRTLTTAAILANNHGNDADRTVQLAEVHSRNNRALMGVLAALLGFSALLVGGFSRFGLWRQIALGIFIMVIIKSVDNSASGLVQRDASYWPLLYAVNLLGLAASLALLWRASRPDLTLARLMTRPDKGARP